MKTSIFFVAVMSFFLMMNVPLNAKDRDTCQVLIVDNIVPYSHVQAKVRVFALEDLMGLVIPLTWDSVTPDLTCDSVQWSDWFWEYPADLYSGVGDLANYIDSTKRTIEIVAGWILTHLPAKDTILASIHFTVGKIDLVEPNGGEEWKAGEGRFIRWLSQCDWKAGDSVVIDTFRAKDNEPLLPIYFSYASPPHPDSVDWDTSYLIRAPESWDSVTIEYSYDAGKTWNLIASATPNDGQLLWSSIPDTPSDSCLLRITSRAQDPVSVTSAGFFTIAETGNVIEEKKEGALPATFVLHQNYPNPFNPSTKIEFSLARGTHVILDIYSITGRRVKRLVDEELPSGHWSTVWNGDDDRGQEVASGVYFYRLKTSQYTQTRKMVIVR